MSHRYDNVRPLLRDRISDQRRIGRPAKVMPLHPHFHDPRLWHAVGLSLLAVGTLVALTAMLVFALRSSTDLLGHLAAGWRWS